MKIRKKRRRGGHHAGRKPRPHVFQVQFKCPECGNVTPTTCSVPPRTHPERPLRLHVDCYHCDAELMEQTTLGHLHADRQKRS